MNIQVIQDEVPLRGLEITGNQPLNMRKSILFGARWSPRWFDDLAGDDIQIKEPGQGAMSDIFEFASQRMAGLHGQSGMLALQGLYAGQLIHADRAFPHLGPLGGTRIQLTPLDNLFVSPHIGNLG